MKKFTYTIGGNSYDVEIQSLQENVATVVVNGNSYVVELEDNQPTAPLTSPVTTKATSSATSTPASSSASPTPKEQPSTPKPTAVASENTTGQAICSPLPGVIIDITVKVGDAVKKGDKLMVLEAMKMENDIKADTDGSVLSIAVQKNDNVQEGATLITIG